MNIFHRLFLILLLCFSIIGFSTVTFSADMTTEQSIDVRLKSLSNELRCLVCQNSTLADSDAPLAKDLRSEIRKLMVEGKTNDEVVDYLVARYGDFVTFRPPVNASTALLWFGPFLMLFIGAITLVVVLKKRASLLNSTDKSP
ncbi:MAG: cytochrome c-type biogenesis protein CcmH [Methylophilaceae bacterium]